MAEGRDGSLASAMGAGALLCRRRLAPRRGHPGVGEDGVVSTEGSWEAGVDGAEAGIAIWATPHLHREYREYHQEYDAGNAEDVGEVLRTGVCVEAGGTAHDGARLTMDTTPLEPAVTELRFSHRWPRPFRVARSRP